MNTVAFNGEKYTNKSLFNLKGSELVALHNAAAKKLKQPETKRFSSIGKGVERTWALLEQIGGNAVGEKSPAPKVGAPAVSTGPTASMGTAKVKGARKAGARRGTNLEAPGHAPLACREGSKQAILVDKLSRAKGATMPELIEALSGGNKPWTEATVRSGFGWDLKQKGYGVRSEVNPLGTERFYLVLPVIKGVEQAIPAHTPLKGKPKADARQTKLAV